MELPFVELLLALGLALSAVNGYPNGGILTLVRPNICTTLLPDNGEHGSAGNANQNPYSISAVTSGSTVTVTVNGGSFMAIMLQARIDGSDTANGTFQSPPQNFELLTCNGISGSTVVHSNGGNKPSGTSFIWNIPVGSCETIKFRATIMRSKRSWWLTESQTIDLSDSNWEPWGSCSQVCGGGQRTRSNSCPGVQAQTENCNNQPCFVLGSWSGWSGCSVTCGSGTQQRTRDCTGECTGQQTSETRTCTTNPCTVLGSWSEWSRCPVSCGSGNQMRSRSCSPASSPACSAQQNLQTRTCNTNACPSTVVTSWSEWSRCSNCQISGTQERTRRNNGGTAIQMRTPWQQCNSPGCGQAEMRRTTTCTGACDQFSVFYDDLSSWGPWASCTVPSCGGLGAESRSRNCLSGNCDGATKMEILSPWQSSSCSVSCGSGTQRRVRHCAPPGGCSGQPLTAEQPCTAQACPVVPVDPNTATNTGGESPESPEDGESSESDSNSLEEMP